MVGIAKEDLLLCANHQDDELVQNKIFSRDAENIVFAHPVSSRAIVFPILRFLGVTSREFILGESSGDLRFRAEGAREPINKSTLRAIDLAISRGLGGDAFHF